MLQTTASGWAVLGLVGQMLWAGSVLAVPCQSNFPATNPDSVYIDHGDGTVTDTRTGLMWKQCNEGLSGATCEIGSSLLLNWDEALALAEASTFAGYSDWRLPNVKELSSLVEECRREPAINTNLFPTIHSTLWSGSPVAAPPVSPENLAWGVNFNPDGVVFPEPRAVPLELRYISVILVRGAR